MSLPAGNRSIRDNNRVPLLYAVSYLNPAVGVQVTADPATGALLVEGGGGGTQYTDGASAPAHPIGTIPVFNNAGTIEAVSVANPLPVTGGGGGTQYQELVTTSPATGTLALGRYVSSLPTLTTGQMNEPMLDSSSRLLVTETNSSTIVTDLGTINTSIGTSNTSLATIVTNTAGLSTSANQTNGTQQTKLTNGTNIVDVVAGDTGFNGVAIAGASKSYTFTTSSSGAQTILANTPTEGYVWMEIVYTSVGSGLALTGQFATTSGGTYNNSSSFGAAPGSPKTSGLGVTANTIYDGPVRGNFFQIAVSALTSGTFTGTVTLRSIAPPPGTQNVNGVISVTGSAATTSLSITTNASTVTTGSLTGYGGYAEISVHGTYAGVQFGITESDDAGTTFYNPPIYDQTVNQWLAGGSTITPGTNASKIYYVPLYANTAQIKVTASAYSSGTATVNINRTAIGIVPPSNMSQIMDSAGNNRGANVDANGNLNVTAISQSATGSAVPANAFMIGISDGVNLLAARTGLVDANTSATLNTDLFIYNGTNKDRVRSANGASGTTGTGLLGSNPMLFDGTNYQKQTTNSTTYTSKYGADTNLLGTLGTAFTTAGLVDIKGTDGNVFVRQTTGSNLHVVADSGSTTAVTQATAANLNATVVGTGTFAVQSTPVVDTVPATQNITAADTNTTSTPQQNSQNAITGSPTANSSATFNIATLDTISVQVTGTWVGTLISEFSIDGGTTYFTRGIHVDGTNYTVASFTSNVTGNMNSATVTQVRVRCTAYTSGTATVRIAGSVNSSTVYLVNSPQIADGTTPSQKLGIDSSGRVTVINAAGTNNIGNVGTVSAAVNVGQQTVNTSAVQISSSSTVPTNGILIGALSTNSASIFVGGSGVTTSNGVELQAGSSLPFTANLNTLYIISAASTTDKIWYNVT